MTLWEVNEAAEEIRAAADPEANIIFGASFNERLGDEVMVTVIATGFDGTRKREPIRREAAAIEPTDAHASIRAPRERDFLQELERQRTQLGDELNGEPAPGEESAAALRPERSVGEPVPVVKRATYDADDLEIPSFLRRK
jgi:cell division protein FtsZ